MAGARIVVLAALMAGCAASDGSRADAAPADARGADAAPADARTADAAPADAAVADAGRAFVQVGTGEGDFEPLTAGQRVPIIRGAQGGFHVWGGFRGDGFDPAFVHVAFALYRAGDDTPVADSAFDDVVARGPGGDYEYAAVFVVFHRDIADPDVRFDGQRMRLEVSIDDHRGVRLRDAVEVETDCCEGVP